MPLLHFIAFLINCRAGRLTLQLLLLFSTVTITAHAQNAQSSSLNIGDMAPQLLVREWLKGEPVDAFEKGKIYVIELWATWCIPCKAAMPHLSALARQYKNRVTVIGVGIKEFKTTSREKVKAFVDSMGNRMDYTVAVQDSNFIEQHWMLAAGEQGIPKSFVIDAEGRLAWIGHPSQLDKVIPEIVNNSWDITAVLAKRNFDRYLHELDDSLNYDLMNYDGDRYNPKDLGQPDSALYVINEITRKEPGLKYAPHIAWYTFSALLKTDPHKAYEYGKVAIVTPTYEEAPYYAIIAGVGKYSDKLNLPPEIYRLGAEAIQIDLDDVIYPEIELVNSYKDYNTMAGWYWRANDKIKAIEAQQKAIDALKTKKNFSKAELVQFESTLKQYKKL